MSERPNLPALSSAPKGSALVKWRKRLNASSYRFVWNILNMGDGHNFVHLNGEKWTMIINHHFFGVSYFQTNPYPKVLCIQWFFSEWSLQRPWKIQPVWAVSVKGLLFTKLGCFRFSAQKQTPPVQFIPNMAQLQFCGFIPPFTCHD